MKFFKSLRFRLILLVLVAVIPALVITLFSGLEQRRLARLNAEGDAYQLAGLLANYQSDQVEGARQLLLSLSLVPELRNGSDCDSYLRQLKTIYPSYNSFSVANLEGTIVCTSVVDAPSVNIADREYFQAALQARQFVVGKTIIERQTGKAGLPFAMPINDQNGNPIELLVADLDLNQILNFVKTMKLPEQSSVLVIDQNGLVLLRYPETEKWSGQQLPNTPIIQKILTSRGTGSAEVPGIDGILRMYSFTPFTASSSLSVYAAIGTPTRIAYAEADRSLRNNLFGIGIAALLALGLSWFGGEIFFLRVVSLTAERDKAERLLKEANASLEERVAQRTAELARANEQLQAELGFRKRIEQALRQRENELKETVILLERSNRDLQDFAYVASHDLQEPLRKIQAFGDRLKKRYASEISGEGSEFIERMTSSASRMQLMINDLLTYSRVTTQGRAFARTDLKQVAEEVVSDLEIRIRETQGKVIVEDLPTIEADPIQMGQLFQNLIANSLKFHQPGVPPEVHLWGEVVVDENGKKTCDAVINIEDNGIGFDEKYLDRIFQPFQRLHGKTEYEGSGIGLSVCRKIIERHGGRITATSQQHVGSRFIVTLPIEQGKTPKGI